MLESRLHAADGATRAGALPNIVLLDDDGIETQVEHHRAPVLSGVSPVVPVKSRRFQPQQGCRLLVTRWRTPQRANHQTQSQGASAAKGGRTIYLHK